MANRLRSMFRFPPRGDAGVWNRLLFATFAMFVMVAVAGCGVIGGDDEPITGDLDLLAELRAGIPAEPSMYELRDMRCERHEDRVEISAVLVNRLDTWWAFEPEFVVTTTEGQEISERSLIDGLEAGEEMVVDWWFGGPERFADPPDCRVNVLHSTFLAYQDDDRLDQIRQTLDQ